MQFHLEIEDNTIKKWLSNNSYRESLENEFGTKYLKNLEKKKKNFKKIQMFFVVNFLNFL